MVSLMPAFTIGFGVTVIIKLSKTDKQFPFAVEVNFITTIPAAISAGDNWYIEVKLVVEGENKPEPVPDQIPVVEPTETVPLIATVGLLAQTATSGLIPIIGGLVNLIIKLSKVFGQPFKLPVDVKLIVTLFAAKSAGEGRYVVFNEPVLPNEPEPVVVQLAPAAYCKVPLKETGDILFLQSVTLAPAVTTGDLKI